MTVIRVTERGNRNTYEKIENVLEDDYGLEISAINPISTGVGGDTFHIAAVQGEYIFKISDTNEMNHPDAEPILCSHLLTKGIPVSEFLMNKAGEWVTAFDGRVGHLQKFFYGKPFPMNGAPEWFLAESPRLLAGIHNALRSFSPLPIGIGSDFFRYMIPERAETSYRRSMERATACGNGQILEDLKFRIDFLHKIRGWQFDISRLTCTNTHGDYTVNQIICEDNQIEAVIDWTSACVHPVIWEITRSFFYADPFCRDGNYDPERFRTYVSSYSQLAPLNDYDRDNLLKLYYYQLAVCDYYGQYLDAKENKKEEFLQQARFATDVLRNAAL